MVTGRQWKNVIHPASAKICESTRLLASGCCGRDIRWKKLNRKKNGQARVCRGTRRCTLYFKNPKQAPMIPIKGPMLTLVDTAAALVTWGRLTAYCVEEDRYIQITHFGEPVTNK